MAEARRRGRPWSARPLSAGRSLRQGQRRGALASSVAINVSSGRPSRRPHDLSSSNESLPLETPSHSAATGAAHTRSPRRAVSGPVWNRMPHWNRSPRRSRRNVRPLASRWFTDRADFTSMATTLPSGRSTMMSTSTPERSRKWANVSASSMVVACRVSSATTNDSRNAPSHRSGGEALRRERQDAGGEPGIDDVDLRSVSGLGGDADRPAGQLGRQVEALQQPSVRGRRRLGDVEGL